MPWEPTNVIEEDLGHFRIVINGEDVTYYQGVPTVINGWTANEPFGDATAEIVLPQITPFHPQPFPSFIVWWASVDIFLGDQTLFEGMISSFEYQLDAPDSFSFALSCVGLLYQLDLYTRAPPILTPGISDVGEVIYAQFPIRPALRIAPPAKVTTGIKTRLAGSGNPVLTGYIQDVLSQAVTDDGTNQWTLMSLPGRQCEIRLKDLDTEHWHVRCGTPGVTHRLSLDLTSGLSAVYGEGTSPEGYHWRNSKYPNVALEDPPPWPNTYINVGSTGLAVLQFKQHMIDSGWTAYTQPVDHYNETDKAITRFFQGLAGLTIDGIVGPQTWTAAFLPGWNAGALNGAFYLPLAEDMRTEPNLYNPAGAKVADNPAFDPKYVRIERWLSFGEKIAKADGERAARALFERDRDPVLVGIITFKTDPAEGSRYFIRPGQNIVYEDFYGTSPKLHVVSVDVNLNDESVTVTVDEKARDLLMLQQIWQRDRDTNDPAGRKQGQHRNSKVTEDRIVVFDVEAGAGRIPRLGLQARKWSVIRIPAGERGGIAKSEAHTDSPFKFTLGVFDKPISPAQLHAIGEPDDELEPYWDKFPYPDYGLIVAWGDGSMMAGEFENPFLGTIDVDGQFHDDATWYFESTQPPWLWVALWCQQTTWIQGQFWPTWEG